MPDSDDTGFRPTRRIVFHGLGALGVAVALAGCGNNTGGTNAAPDQGGGGAGSGNGGPASGTALAKTSEIPVGGGLILPDDKVVITQPSKGTFKAFSAVCTHQGFIVTSVSGGLIMCNHHGSEYSAKTGSVVQGPAPASLAAVGIVVKGTEIRAS
jgi:Rieske Fe-S protein